MTSGIAAACASARAWLRHEILARGDQHRQDDELVADDRGGQQRLARRREDGARRNRRERAHESRQHPEREQQGDAGVGHQIELEPGRLFDPERAGGGGGNREDAVGRQPHDEPHRPRQRVAGDREDVEQHLLAGQAVQRHADDHREQHHRGHDAVGECEEGVRRNVQVDQIEGLRRLEERGAEERGVLTGRKGQRHQEREAECQCPERQQHQRDAEPEAPEFGDVQRADAPGDRHRDVRQHRHLHQLDEAVGDGLQHTRVVAEEESRGDSREQSRDEVPQPQRPGGRRRRTRAHAGRRGSGRRHRMGDTGAIAAPLQAGVQAPRNGPSAGRADGMPLPLQALVNPARARARRSPWRAAVLALLLVALMDAGLRAQDPAPVPQSTAPAPRGRRRW